MRVGSVNILSSRVGLKGTCLTEANAVGRDAALFKEFQYLHATGERIGPGIPCGLAGFGDVPSRMSANFYLLRLSNNQWNEIAELLFADFVEFRGTGRKNNDCANG